MPEGKIRQLQRERDEAKSTFDDVKQQRDALIGELDATIKAAASAQERLQVSISLAATAAASAARAQLAELLQRREELQAAIASLGARQSLLQRQFGDCHDRWRHAEEDREWMRSRILLRHDQLRKAQGEDSPAIDAIRTDLERCEDRFFVLTGEHLSAEASSVAA